MGGSVGPVRRPISCYFVLFFDSCAEVCFPGMSQPVCTFLRCPSGLFPGASVNFGSRVRTLLSR